MQSVIRITNNKKQLIKIEVTVDGVASILRTYNLDKLTCEAAG